MAGFECEFVDQPPTLIQTECPLCLLVLKDPQQATCCGKSFCNECVLKLWQETDEDEPVCPTCKAEDDYFTTYSNKWLELSLYGLKVYCSHKSKGCEWTGELRELENHLNSDPPADKSLEGCPLEEIHCPLKYAGCEEKLPRREMADHLEERTVGHMLMQAKKHCSDNTKFQLVKMEKERLERNVSQLQSEVKRLNKELKSIKDARELANSTGQPIGQVEFVMTNFEQHKRGGPWHSPSFYTHPHGYKMALSVHPNGHSHSEVIGTLGTHVSVFVHILRGEVDDQLTWPFHGAITLMLVDQEEDKRHITRKITFNEHTPEMCKQRVAQGIGLNPGHGNLTFLPLTYLTPFYLKNDSLKFRIVQVELNKTVSTSSTS